jgi:protein involved in polysaccharide export with SLBB domain
MASPMAATTRPMSSLAKGASHLLPSPLAATLAVTEAREEPETAARVDPGEVVRVTVTGAPLRVSVWMMTTGWTIIG